AEISITSCYRYFYFFERAAHAGLDLLNQQVELQSRLDEQRVEMTNALEALEQEKYSLQKELELKSRMLDSLQTDYECRKNQQREELEIRQEHLERKHSMVVSDLQNKMLRLQAALDESQLKEKHQYDLKIDNSGINGQNCELKDVLK
uniref:Uncharacterized protein n=1 Tax=Gouania willdenowi TaxID=441366 RepID=A0A8C5D0N7_GOUWI